MEWTNSTQTLWTTSGEDWVHQRKIEMLFPEKWNIYPKKGKYTTHTHTHTLEMMNLELIFPLQTEPIAPLHGGQWWSFQGQYKDKHFSLTLWKCMGAPFHSLGNVVINCLCLLNISSSCEAIYESWCSLQRQAFLESLLDKYRREFMWSVLWYTLCLLANEIYSGFCAYL